MHAKRVSIEQGRGLFGAFFRGENNSPSEGMAGVCACGHPDDIKIDTGCLKLRELASLSPNAPRWKIRREASHLGTRKGACLGFHSL
jgi:hypothetical protein